MSIESAAKGEIHPINRYFVVKKKSPYEKFNEVRNVYEEGHMNRTSVYKWCKEFKNGCINVHDDPRRWRLLILIENMVKNVKNAIQIDWMKFLQYFCHRQGIVKP